MNLYMLLLIGCCIVNTFAIECFECSNRDSARRRRTYHRRSDFSYGNQDFDNNWCVTVDPNVVNNVRCSSDKDICIKSVIYDGHVNENGEKMDVIRRDCASSKKLLLNNHMNESLLLEDKVSKCYSEEVPKVSAPYDHLLCVCYTNLCNGADRLNSSKLFLLKFSKESCIMIYILITLFYISFFTIFG